MDGNSYKSCDCLQRHLSFLLSWKEVVNVHADKEHRKDIIIIPDKHQVCTHKSLMKNKIGKTG